MFQPSALINIPDNSLENWVGFRNLELPGAPGYHLNTEAREALAPTHQPQPTPYTSPSFAHSTLSTPRKAHMLVDAQPTRIAMCYPHKQPWHSPPRPKATPPATGSLRTWCTDSWPAGEAKVRPFSSRPQGRAAGCTLRAAHVVLLKNKCPFHAECQWHLHLHLRKAVP